jgi:hypothetical protein
VPGIPIFYRAMPRLYRVVRLQIGSLLALLICLSSASGQDRMAADFGPVAAQDFDAAGGCPTRFDYEVLAGAADSGNLLGLSAYRFRDDTRYNIPLGVFQCVADRPEGAEASPVRAVVSPK